MSALNIEGEIELSLFPRIGLAVQGVSAVRTEQPRRLRFHDSMRLAVAVWAAAVEQPVHHVTINGLRASSGGKRRPFPHLENLVGGSVQSTDVLAGNAAEAPPARDHWHGAGHRTAPSARPRACRSISPAPT